jgi:PAS domain S-box-containing protein
MGIVRKNRWMFLVAILTIVGILFGSFSAYIFQQQKSAIDGWHRKRLMIEAELIGALLKDHLLRGDYSEAVEVLESWPGTHDYVVYLEAAYEGRAPLFRFGSDEKLERTYVAEKDFPLAGRNLRLAIAHDVSDVRANLSRLGWNLFVLAALLVLLVGAAVWYLLFNWMIEPLEREIRDRERAEAELRKLSRAVEQSPNMIFITDVAGIIEYVNPRFTEFTGFARAEVLGRKPDILKSGRTPPAVYEDMWKTLLRGEEWRGEIEDRHKDGGFFWASVLISPVRDQNGAITHFVAMHEDITARRRAEESVREAKEQAEVASRAKSELLANMSHELRTPLNAIIGFSQTILEEYFGPIGNEKYREYIGDINASGSHLLDLINDILDVSAVEAGRMELHDETLDVAEICDSAIRILATKAQERHVTMTGLREKTLPALRADRRRLKQIFLNLLSNAVKFTPEDGSVTCDAWLAGDGWLAVVVADTGIGMDEAGIAKALTLFGQVDSSLSRSHEGTGLGLPLTKGLMELHGGTLSVESRPNAGTRIVLRFPPDRIEAHSPGLPTAL